jgi:hypothetical protein
MSLPPREEFDLESAAKYLDCSDSDVRYYLEKGDLRLAIPVSLFQPFHAILFDELSVKMQDKLESLYNPAHRDLLNIKLDRDVDTIEIGDFVYLHHHQRDRIIRTIHQLGEPIWIFESFEGEKITIWYDNVTAFELWKDELWYEKAERFEGTPFYDKNPALLWFYQEEGWICDTVLSREELDKHKPNDVEVPTEPKVNELPFKLPEKVNETASVMVEYGNSFYKEHGYVPTYTELENYLLKHAEVIGFNVRSKDEMDLGFGGARHKYDFNGYGVSNQQFKARYKTYKIL